MSQSDIQSLTASLQQIMHKNHLAGRVLLFNKAQQIHLETAVGYANFKHKILNENQKVVYPTASLQKIMTATMILQIMTESAHTATPITEFSTLDRWFPNLENSSTITIGNLLTHTSGIVDLNSEKNVGYIMSENEAITATIQRINKTKITLPTFYYDNDNYILLAGILKKYTEKSYSENIESRLIKPLNLHDTYMWNDLDSKHILATSYQSFGPLNYRRPRDVNQNLLSYILGAGNLYSTPHDYFKFQEALDQGQILSQSAYRTLNHLAAQPKNGYSGGMYHKNSIQQKIVSGSLRNTHFKNFVQFSEDNQHGIIIFANQANHSHIVRQTAQAMTKLILNVN